MVRRFIPARAGNTRRRGRSADSCQVHPRSRGEHILRHVPQPLACGSSPLARGTPRHHPQRTDGRRFIPARAGNTSGAGRVVCAAPVHPRSRGEHSEQRDAGQNRVGSSPLARGTRGGCASGSVHARFIPARAGNTAAPCDRARRRPVHPRSRGEHSPYPPSIVSTSGSSPLARGTHGCRWSTARQLRFIPARAGNTQDDAAS